jgi:Cu(I)/Ag(I) efflux system membrane fusion protein
MKTKQIIGFIGILILGILIGKFAFSNQTHKEELHEAATHEEHWTCSMHPQIDLPEFGDCPICGMDLILKEEGSSEELPVEAFTMTKNAMALANIQTMKIGMDKADKTNFSINLSGIVQPDKKETAIQTAHFGGRIEKLHYKSVGEYVNKGSLIAVVYSPELVTAQNEFIEALDIKTAQPELYQAVRNKLRNWKITEKQIQQIELTKKVITNFSMYANVSGYIEEILVQEGNHIKEGSPLFKVADLSKVWAVFDVYEQDIKHFKIGQQLKIVSNAFSDKEIQAQIDYIDPVLDVKTRTIKIRATLINKNKLLKPGMLLQSEVYFNNTKQKKENPTIEVPKTAVMWTGKRSIVYLKIKSDETAFQLREITLGTVKGSNYEVIEGLETGDEVVINGTFTMDASAQLLGKRSMMNVAKEEKDDDIKTTKLIHVNPKFKNQINNLFNAYIVLKDAFVLTDVKKVKTQAALTLSKYNKVAMKLLKKPEAHQIWMKESKLIQTALNTIIKEQSIEKQRFDFIALSDSMILLATTFGVNDTIYVQHCPMANGHVGADWLSLEKEINNPYFGDKMLRCGSVEQTLNK